MMNSICRRVTTVLPEGDYQYYSGIVMFVSRAANYAVRLSLAQSQSTTTTAARKSDPTVLSAVLLAGIGLGLSSFSLKQLLSSATARGARSAPRL